jgi:organic radical activating enzyme
MYHYQTPPDALQPYRLHLRLEPDGLGMLIVNASTILHLNQTASEFAYHLVKGTPVNEAVRQIASRYRVSYKRAMLDFIELNDRIQTLIQTPDLDPEMFLDFDRTLPANNNPSAPYRLDCALTYRLQEGVNPAYTPTRRVERELTTQEWLQILDKAWSVGIPHIIFTGGEPTLRDDLPILLTHAEENGQVTGLITDGVFFTDPDKSKVLLETGLDHVLITIQPGDLSSWTAIDNAIAADIFVAVHLTINLQNALTAESTVKKLAQRGVKHLSLSSADVSLHNEMNTLRNMAAALNMSLIWDLPVPYSAFNPVSLEIQEDPSSREGGPTSLYVEPDGDVLPAQGINQILGNLLSDPWDKIWRKRI